ncbi:hypothetical protein [Winogradskyella ludwigii]|uniref:hypothetical protein n=1 Tax=Winogradskyella ludwigii TaxID=2686076 RepID=UPI0015CE742F|nr:hypothetical protein [Winogradskyella ludwigii]
MKKILLILMLLISNHMLWCQDIDALEFPKYIKSEVSQTVYAYIHSKNTEITKKLDSLKASERKSLTDNIIGTWEYLESECNDCIAVKKDKSKKQYIQITPHKILFYEGKISKKNLIKTEEFEFTNQLDMFSDLKNLVYANKSLWSFNVDKTGKYLRIYWTGKEDKTSRNRVASGFVFNYYQKIK